MGRTAIILAGGFSGRLGQDKGMIQLVDKPLIEHVLGAVSALVDEKIVVTSSKAQAEKYTKTLGSHVRVLVDVEESRGPLAGALTGFEETRSEYTLLLPCDTPFVSRDVVLLLFELSMDKNAVIPRWPSGYIEPLQAVYRVKTACEAAELALGEGESRMRSMVDKLRAVRYVSTLVLQQVDAELKTFFNVNTPLDLRKAELMLKHVNRRHST